MAAPDTDPVASLKQVPWYLWFAGAALLLDSYHVVESGLPQPADFVTAAFLGAMVVRSKGTFSLPRTGGGYVLLLIVLVAWIAHVNLWWTWYLRRPVCSLNTAYYVFGLGVTLVFLSLVREHGERIYRGLVYALFCGLLGQVLLAPLVIDWSTFRQDLFFNDPNQMAYYAILSSAVLLGVSQRVSFGTRFMGVYFAVTTFLVILSVSRAGFAAVMLQLLMLARMRPTTFLLGAVAFGGAFLVLAQDAGFQDGFFARITNTSENMERGYPRMWHHPAYMLLGAGESTSRVLFDEDYELHSNFGTMVFSYGLPGLLLYAGLYLEILRRAPARLVLSMAGPLLVGLTIQGMRVPLYWIHLAVVLSLTECTREASTSPISGARDPGPPPL